MLYIYDTWVRLNEESLCLKETIVRINMCYLEFSEKFVEILFAHLMLGLKWGTVKNTNCFVTNLWEGVLSIRRY